MHVCIYIYIYMYIHIKARRWLLDEANAEDEIS